MSLRILLTADVHLGLKFSNYPQVQKELTEARFEALKKVVNAGNERQCDILVVAGDLFDHLRVSDRDVVEAAQILCGFQGKIVTVLPGNHDFIIRDERKLWHKFKTNAGDRVLVLEESKVYNLEQYDLNVNVYAAPCDAKHSGTNCIGWIKNEPKDSSIKYHIGIAHGSLLGVSPDPDKKFFPMSEEELSKTGLDLWLMGHTDRLQYPVQVGPLSRIFYPGTPEPNGFDCNHDGRVWILELNDEKDLNATSLKVGTYRFLHDEFNVSSGIDIKRLVEKYSTQEYATTLLKLKLRGYLPKEEFDSLKHLTENLKKYLCYIEVDDSDVRQEITYETIDREFTKDSFPHQLLNLLANESDGNEALQIAYEIIQEVRK